MASKPLSFSGNLKSVIIMDWISEIEMVFERCNCSNRQKTIFVVRQLKTWELSWWKLLAQIMPQGEAIKMSWGNFLVQLKREYYMERDHLEINNSWHALYMWWNIRYTGKLTKLCAYSLYLNVFNDVLVRKEMAQHDFTRICVTFLDFC